jgi:hypothetical protein
MKSRAFAISLAVFVATGALLSLTWVRIFGRTRALLTPSATSIQYIRCSHLQAHACEALKAMGNRLEVPGKERLTITGSLTRTLPQSLMDTAIATTTGI